jgi:hypothetical protein
MRARIAVRPFGKATSDQKHGPKFEVRGALPGGKPKLASANG